MHVQIKNRTKRKREIDVLGDVKIIIRIVKRREKGRERLREK